MRELIFHLFHTTSRWGLTAYVPAAALLLVIGTLVIGDRQLRATR